MTRPNSRKDILRKIASEFGRRGGQVRAKALTPEQRQKIAKKAVQTRWARNR